jgi:hypothetical protein
MSGLDSLAASALVGTGRRAPDWPDLPGEVGATLSKIDRDNAEKAALQVAGVIAVCALAGLEPPTRMTEADLSPEDTSPLREVPAALHPRLHDICVEGPARLQAEAMGCLARGGYRWPARLLPMALECGKREQALRPFVVAAIGRRGIWLAGQNSSWTYATGVAEEGQEEETWRHGTHEQRKAALGAMRGRDAAAARIWLQDAIPTEGARERAALVACLTIGLSTEDEPLLETLLKDKSKEVRQTSLTLLSSMPGSSLCRRMAGRLDACLTVTKKLLRSAALSIEPPEAFDPAWAGDLIEETPPKGSKYGARAWWLRQIARSVPLEWWEAKSSMTPEKLLDWARSTDWKDAIVAAWAEAVLLQQKQSWAEAFLKASPVEAGPLPFDRLLSILPQTAREEQALALMRRSVDPAPLSATLSCLLQALPLGETLSHNAAAQILIMLRGVLEVSAYDLTLRGQFVEFAAAAPESLIDAMSKGWPAEGSPSVLNTISRILTVLDHRKDLYRLPS